MKEPLLWDPAFSQINAWDHAFSPSYGFNVCGTAPTDINSVPALGLGAERQPGTLGYYRPRREPEIAVPSDMIAIGDYLERSSQHGEIAFHGPINFISDRHSGGGNVAFCDGHVEYGKQTIWMKPSDVARKRWNYDNQPHPETWK
jgi:prepilin-type processing-associated H-X9-DG protein